MGNGPKNSVSSNADNPMNNNREAGKGQAHINQQFGKNGSTVHN